MQPMCDTSTHRAVARENTSQNNRAVNFQHFAGARNADWVEKGIAKWFKGRSAGLGLHGCAYTFKQHHLLVWALLLIKGLPCRRHACLWRLWRLKCWARIAVILKAFGHYPLADAHDSVQFIACLRVGSSFGESSETHHVRYLKYLEFIYLVNLQNHSSNMNSISERKGRVDANSAQNPSHSFCLLLFIWPELKASSPKPDQLDLFPPLLRPRIIAEDQ